MLPVAIIFAVPAGVIAILHLVMYVGLFRAKVRERRIGRDETSLPSACVVVPARDEERLLPRLLASLEAQVDPCSIVLVDDRSSDATGRMMDEFGRKHPEQVTVIHITETVDIGNHKLYALIQGVAHANADCILFTDADCVAPPSWVGGMRATFRDASVGLVLGPIETIRNGTLLSLFHSFDHVFKYSYNAGCTGIDQATGGFGNNLAVRRSALDEIGGLDSIEVSVTEDAALVTAVRERTDFRIISRFQRPVTIRTEPQPDFRTLTEQEVRWHTGGLFSPDAVSRLSYRFIMFYLTASILAIPFAPIVPILTILPAVSFFTMSGMAVLAGIFTRQPFSEYWRALLPYVIAEMFYDSFLTIKAMCRPVLIWKGERVSGERRS